MFNRLWRGLGLAPRRFAEVASGSVFLHGSGDHAFTATAPRRFQQPLSAIVGAAADREAGAIATLDMAPSRRPRHERIAVVIADDIVGYCPPELAVPLQDWAEQWRLQTATITCRARVLSAPDRNASGMFVVTLDVALPLQMTVVERGDAP